VSGVVPPNGKANVEITFAPSEEKSHNFNLVCNVRRKPTKLSLNVKGEGYAIHDRMDLEEDMTESGGGVIFTEITRGSGDMNYVDFGTTHINEKVVRKVVITNSGKFNFDFSWARSKNPMLMVSPEAGTVKKGEKLVCTMLFNPVKEVSLDQFSMECTVAGSRVYKMSVVARAIRYALNFSWMKHNFGPTFVAAPGAPPQSEECMLTIVNQELDEDVSLDCLWEKNSFLDVQCPPTVMPPDSTLQIPIVFTAREHKKYSGKIPFLVNGTSTIFVDVEGEGCGVKIELASPAHQAVNFGSLQVGQEVSRQVKLVNRSKRSATFELIDPIVAGRGQLDQYAVSFFPVGETTLGPRESCVVDLQFRPLQRVAKFTEELQILVAGSTRKLLTVTGACTGMEVHLETETLPFGSVCEKSNLTRHLQMENTGDMVTKYQWDAKAFGPDFSISPAEGLLAPFSQIKFEITFHPRRIDDDIRYEGLACYLEGANPVHVTLTGACIAQPDSDVKELQFETKARTTQSQSVTVANPSDKDWCLLPVLQGENWTQSSETLDIPAKKSADFEVIYQPLSMTGGADGTDVPHNGTLFFALPDGTALLYNLSGIASDPEAEEQLSFETRAKQSLPIKLPVKNWLKTSQRFSVDIKLDEDSQTGSVFLNGGKTVDVPALQARDYNLKFYSFKEGTYNATVTFTNPKTGEYIAHSLVFTATAPGTAETIALEAPVRATASKIVTISNPLDASQPVTFPADDSWWKCDNPNVRVKQLGNMSGASEGNFEIRYRPLLPSEETCMLVLSCPELGDYNYELKLKATAAGTERALNFKSSLGATQEQVFKFRSFVPEGCTYACSVSNKDFFRVAMETVQAPPSADWEGQEVSVKVFFEPNQMGDVKDILKISSPTGGDFACILQGQCTQPLPRGPFTLKKGESQDISFKNVFSDAREFIFTVDNAEFAVATDKSSIAAKAEFNVKVTFKGENAKPAGVSGKLLVSCGTELPPWVFYLKGDMSA
jgi:hydrocephalus-inducing protein